MAVVAGNTFVGSPSSGVDMGLAVPDDTAIDDISRGCLISGFEEGEFQPPMGIPASLNLLILQLWVHRHHNCSRCSPICIDVN